MPNGNVGAGILNIITESLYDKPIVVFREYVQNSVDSFQKVDSVDCSEDLISKIQYIDENLLFIDNGNGIAENEFEHEMTDIGRSKKQRKSYNNIGYKGIGRLSGLPYCKRIIFINILSYEKNEFQKYIIDGDIYNEIKSTSDINDLLYDDIISKISTYKERVGATDIQWIRSYLSSHQSLFCKRDKGFFVFLENINPILKQTIDRIDFVKELGWLLPVKFNNELLDKEKNQTYQLFQDMIEPIEKTLAIPAKSYNVFYNNELIIRPIKSEMLRDYTCKANYNGYAVGFHTFNHDRIQVEKNEFYGIKLYIDNILLCDENELIPILQQYGLVRHSANELIQTVKGIGAIIYIIDKINISANARRTFIEVTDSDSYDLLKLLANFVNNVYETRYALSRYNAAKNDLNQQQDRIAKLKVAANVALQELAKNEITISFEDETPPAEFKDLGRTDQIKAVKKKITSYINQKIKNYLIQTNVFDYENATSDFLTWFNSNK